MEKIVKENAEKLGKMNYPGRVIITGLTPSNKKIVQIYCTMGRSESSQNRQLIEKDKHIKTVPLNFSIEMENIELLIYDVACQVGDSHIVSNGTQTSTIEEYILSGRSFEEAISTWKHEPDSPNFTSRISGIVELDKVNNKYIYKLNLIKALPHDKKESEYHTYMYNSTEAGTAHCIHVYCDDNIDCLPYEGDPYLVPTFETLEENADYYWNLMPIDKKIGMYIKMIDISTGETEDKIINKSNQ